MSRFKLLLPLESLLAHLSSCIACVLVLSQDEHRRFSERGGIVRLPQGVSPDKLEPFKVSVPAAQPQCPRTPRLKDSYRRPCLSLNRRDARPAGAVQGAPFS
jgi:hypothetical protein